MITKPSIHQTQTRCFLGIEAEGPYRGRSALFVPGSVDKTEALRCYRKVTQERFVDLIYYGAGNDRKVNRSTLESLASTETRLTVEVDLQSLPVVFGLSAMVVLFLEEGQVRPDEGYDFFKVWKDGNLVWTSRSFPNTKYITSEEDPLFQFDQFVD